MECCKGRSDGMLSPSIVSGRVTLAEVVCLHLVVVTTYPFPVNLIEITRLKNDGSNHALAGTCHQLHVNTAEEDVLLTGDGGSLLVVFDGEEGTLVAIVDSGSRIVVESIAFAFCEIAFDRISSQGRVSRTS